MHNCAPHKWNIRTIVGIRPTLKHELSLLVLPPPYHTMCAGRSSTTIGYKTAHTKAASTNSHGNKIKVYKLHTAGWESLPRATEKHQKYFSSPSLLSIWYSIGAGSGQREPKRSSCLSQRFGSYRCANRISFAKRTRSCQCEVPGFNLNFAVCDLLIIVIQASVPGRIIRSPPF